MKLYKQAQKYGKKAAAAVVATAVTAQSAFAVTTPPDVTPVTSAIDYSTVITGIFAIAGIMATVYVAWKGSVMIIGALKRL